MPRQEKLPALKYSYRQYTLDAFQAEALYHLDCGNSVLLAAPTGTGKTLVADYLVQRTLEGGKRLAYTAPLKALVNQKYRGFAKIFGRDRVGILTGDLAENPEAPIVAMTTEVLRNQLAAGTTTAFHWVVFDEIHYLDHPERGSVWEQALLLLPATVGLLGLSATVPNAEEIAAWMGRLLGKPVALIRHGLRTVPLTHLYFHRALGPIAPANLARCQAQILARQDGGFDPKGGIKGAVDLAAFRPRRLDYREETTHLDLLAHMQRSGLFPCLYFVFSRRGCEEKARQAAARVHYLSPREKDAVRVIARRVLTEAGLDPEEIPEYQAAREMWQAGIGVHHAGLLPVLKETVELLMEARLLRVTYATETFALGVNLPVRAVCFDSLIKFDGQGYRYLTQQEYFQMAGRAGRRGLDRQGAVITLADFAAWQKEPPPGWDEGSLAPIRSRFFLPDHVLLNLTARLGQSGMADFFRHSLAVFQGESPETLRINASARLSLLQQLGYIDGGSLTPRGEVAGRIFQRELAVTELIFAGLLKEFAPADLAALAAALVEEERQGELAYTYRPPRWLGSVEAALARAEAAEKQAGNEANWLDPAFIAPVAKWCHGASLAEVLRTYPQDAGDFVARCRRAIDLLRQIGAAWPELREKVAETLGLLDRGLVKARL